MPVWFWLIATTEAADDSALADRICAAWSDTPLTSPAEALAHAETYYWWARSTANNVELHCRARHAYQGALTQLDAADADGDPAQMAEQRQSAAAGLAQVHWRIDNSFDMFRNIYPLAWWLLGDDPVIEPEDGPGALADYDAHAVAHAWSSMQAVLDDPERPRTLAVIRCGGDPEACPGLRDYMAILADSHPRLATIPDDRGVAFVGAGRWTLLVDGDRGPLSARASAETARALQDATGFDELVRINIDVADRVANPVDGVRAELSADTWDLSTDRQRRLAAGTGVGADLVPRRNLDLAWMGCAILLGLALSPIRQIARPPSMEEESSGLAAAQALGGLLVGAALGLFALRLTGRLAPGMEELALNPIGWPRLATLLWPLAHGALLLVGPLIVSIFIVFGAMPRVNAALAERLDLGLLTLSIQCGALALALAPIPAGEGLAGLLACGAMAAPALAIAAILGERIEQIRGLIEVDPGRQVAPIALAVLGLLAAFPVMLAGAPPALMLGAGAGLAVLVGLLGRPRRISRPRIAAPTEDRPALELSGGSLRRPAYVSLDGRDISPVVGWLSRPGVSVVSVCGGAGLGKSRLGEEIVRALPSSWKVGRSEAEDPQLSEGCVEPYAAVGTALGAIFDQERVELAAIYARQVAVRELAATASDALDFLPGVGLLLGMGGGVNSEQLTLERLRRDIVRAVRRRLREQPVLLIIDDLQWADPSSLSLLDHVLLELSHLPPEALGHPLGVLLLHRPGAPAEEWIERLAGRLAVQSARLEPLSSAGVEALLHGAGVQTGSSDFAEAVRRQVGGVPLNILSLMHELVEQGLGKAEAAEGGGQRIAFPPELDEERLQAVVPGQMADLARQRLGRLRAEELLLLQGAAQCGRRFDATSLSNGFGLPRIEVLRRLRDIEDNHELITDLDDDDHFRFDTEVTRSVLIEMTTKRQGHGQRELVKEFHHRVVGALLEAVDTERWSEEADAARVVRHALNAGSRRSAVAARFAVRAAASAARRFAYTEALRFIEVACDPARRSRLTEAEADRLAEVEARIRRAVGGRDNRQLAIARFEGLLGSPHVDALALARDWFEAIFEEKQPADLTRLAAAIEAVRASHGARRPDPLVEAVCDFYEVLNQTWLDGMRPPEAAVASALARQAARLRDLDDARTADREQLLSWVLQAQATWTASGDEVVRLCQESLLLKERHNDLAGQALTKGVLANHYLFKRREPARARTLLEEDLQILERMGARGQRSSVLNRIAMSDWLESEQIDDAHQKTRLQGRALSNARRAYDAAVQTGRVVDLIFAAFVVLDYGSRQDQAELVSAVGASLVGRPEGWPWPSADALWDNVPGWLKSSKHGELERLRPALERQDGADAWLDALAARLAPPAPAAD